MTADGYSATPADYERAKELHARQLANLLPARHPVTGRFLAHDCEIDCQDYCAGLCGG